MRGEELAQLFTTLHPLFTLKKGRLNSWMRAPSSFISIIPHYRHRNLLVRHLRQAGKPCAPICREDSPEHRCLDQPLSNSINEKCARVRAAFVSQFDESLAKYYYIDGKRGEAKKIILDRKLLEWKSAVIED